MSSKVRAAKARLAANVRHNPTADHTDARRALKLASVEEYVRQVVDSAPPLTPEQRDRIASILRGGEAS